MYWCDSLLISSILLVLKLDAGDTLDYRQSSSWQYHKQKRLEKITRKPRDIKLSTVLGSLDSQPRNVRSESARYETNQTNQNKVKILTLNILPTPSKAEKRLSKYATTRHIKDIFLGRCYEYQYHKGVTEENEWDCGSLWNLFSRAFAYKGPCEVQASDYKEFLDRIEESVPRDKGLLWSGSRELAHKYSDFLYSRRFTTLEDSLAGYLVNGLSWCGTKAPPGIDFNACPWECSIQTPYWSTANQKFGQKLSGVVHILLNGTRQHFIDRKIYSSYMKNRYYLGPYVIPQFRKDRITRVIIIVAHTLHLKPLESCGEKTVQSLLEDIKKKGIPVECYNDRDAIKHILCADDPITEECIMPR